MKKTLTSLLVGAACVAASIVQAAVPTGAIQSFNTRPLAVDWSSLTVPGAGNSIATVAALDAAVATNDIAIITTQVITGAAAPAGNAQAQWNPGGFLVTRPTGNAYTILMATIQNTSGGPISGSFPVSYDLGLPNVFAGEDPEIGGHHAYYSFTGAVGSWTPLPELTQVTPAAGSISADLNLGPWPAGGNLYIIWADDNGGPGTDGSYSIDNFIIGSTPPPPTIVTQPSNTANIVGRTVRLTVVANGGGLVYQWVKIGTGSIDTTANPSAATASLVITNAQLTDTADYYVSISSPFGSVDSTSAHIEITADTVAPRLLRARLGANPLEIIMVVDEELCSDGAVCGTNFKDGLSILTYLVVNINNPDEAPGVISVDSLNTTNIILTLESPWSPENIYRITITHDIGGISDLSGNVTPAGTFVDTDPVITSVAVGPTGSATYTFDTAPGNLEFSTVTFTGGADGVADTTALFDAKVQTLDAATIILPIAEAAGTPPGAGGQANWASAGGYLITRPTGTAGNVIMAHLRNKSGAARPALDISYNLTVEAAVVEETVGHLVYRSFSGAPGSWVQIPGISGDGVTGLKTASIDFGATPWDAEANLYILFADDNGSGSPDNANEIDNFKVSFPALGVPPSITQNPSSVSTNEGAVVNLTVVAAGSPTLQYKWFKGITEITDGGNISGATTARLTISNAAPADAGSYTCRVNNDTPPAATSTAAIVTISGDLTRPVLTRAVGPNNTTVVLTFSKALSLGAGLTSHYTISGGANVTAAVLAGNVVTLTTSARAAGNSTLTITGVTDNRSTPNVINPNPTTVALTTVQVIDGWASAWSYNTNNLDADPTWTTTGGTDWLTGNGLFGTETTAATIALLPSPIVTPLEPNTNTLSPTLVTYYFRKTINLPTLGVGMSYAIEHAIDDGAVFYLDGNEFGRLNMASGPVVFATKATTSGETVLLSLPMPATAGSHVLAVEVHQGGATVSSDIVFGAQIITIPTVGPALSASQVGTNVVLNWTADSAWQLVGSTNVAGPYAPVAGNPSRTLTTPKTQPTQFYELRYTPQP